MLLSDEKSMLWILSCLCKEILSSPLFDWARSCPVGFLARDVRHAESAVAELTQMLMLLVLPVGSNQSNLALPLDILALISRRLTLLGFCCLSSYFCGKNFFSIAFLVWLFWLLFSFCRKCFMQNKMGNDGQMFFFLSSQCHVNHFGKRPFHSLAQNR